MNEPDQNFKQESVDDEGDAAGKKKKYAFENYFVPFDEDKVFRCRLRRAVFCAETEGAIAATQAEIEERIAGRHLFTSFKLLENTECYGVRLEKVKGDLVLLLPKKDAILPIAVCTMLDIDIPDKKG